MPFLPPGFGSPLPGILPFWNGLTWSITVLQSANQGVERLVGRGLLAPLVACFTQHLQLLLGGCLLRCLLQRLLDFLPPLPGRQRGQRQLLRVLLLPHRDQVRSGGSEGSGSRGRRCSFPLPPCRVNLRLLHSKLHGRRSRSLGDGGLLAQQRIGQRVLEPKLRLRGFSRGYPLRLLRLLRTAHLIRELQVPLPQPRLSHAPAERVFLRRLLRALGVLGERGHALGRALCDLPHCLVIPTRGLRRIPCCVHPCRIRGGLRRGQHVLLRPGESGKPRLRLYPSLRPIQLGREHVLLPNPRRRQRRLRRSSRAPHPAQVVDVQRLQLYCPLLLVQFRECQRALRGVRLRLVPLLELLERHCSYGGLREQLLSVERLQIARLLQRGFLLRQLRSLGLVLGLDRRLLVLRLDRLRKKVEPPRSGRFLAHNRLDLLRDLPRRRSHRLRRRLWVLRHLHQIPVAILPMLEHRSAERSHQHRGRDRGADRSGRRLPRSRRVDPRALLDRRLCRALPHLGPDLDRRLLGKPLGELG